MILPGASVMQMAWVVNDLDESVARFSRTLGVGPFMISRHIQLGGVRYRGKSAQLNFSTAISQAGAVQIELVAQHDDQPSVYRDIYAPGREGFHHVAVIVPDVAAEVARYRSLGFEAVFEGLFGTASFAYVDTSATLGHMVEILPDDPGIGRFFSAIRKAAEQWDGKDPAREMRAASSSS